MTDLTPRRVIILAVVYLLCGFVVNVLVAWGCASLSPSDRRDYQQKWIYFVENDGSLSCIAGRPAPVWTEREARRMIARQAALFDWSAQEVVVIAHGSPFPVVYSAHVSGKRRTTQLGYWEGKLPLLGYVQLPMRLAWPGVISGGLFYAMMILVIRLLFIWSKRSRRRRRGLCPRCKYDLRGAPSEGIGGCPECGWRR